jgi:plasmid stabilization system protein ParE
VSILVPYTYFFFLPYDQTSPRQELQTHIQTDRNDIWSHTAQTHTERTATESNLVTAQSTAYDPPEDGRKYRPKHVGATSLKCF